MKRKDLAAEIYGISTLPSLAHDCVGKGDIGTG